MLQSCFFMSLHTGGKVVGGLGVVGGIISYIITICVMGSPNNTAEYGRSFVADGCFLLVVIFVHLICSALLIVGANMNRPGFLLPWLIWKGIFLTSLISLLFDEICKSTVPPGPIFAAVLYLELSIYIYYGILSLYKLIKDTDGRAGHFQA